MSTVTTVLNGLLHSDSTASRHLALDVEPFSEQDLRPCPVRGDASGAEAEAIHRGPHILQDRGSQTEAKQDQKR